jgi:hypothetical protein
VIFAEFYGSDALYAGLRTAIEQRIAEALRARPEDVVLRRSPIESHYPGTEIWVELSSEEQLAQYGREVAERVTAAIRPESDEDVWVLFRIVPLSHVFLNGEPRRRGAA